MRTGVIRGNGNVGVFDFIVSGDLKAHRKRLGLPGNTRANAPATLELSTRRSEGTGIFFGTDPLFDGFDQRLL